jgi:hypothetical protein
VAAAPAVQLAGALADTKSMAKKTRQRLSRPLTPGEVRRIRELHEREDVRAYLQIGGIVDYAIGVGERAAQGTSVLDGYSKQLGRRLSVSMLTQCRRLHRWWKDDRQAAVDAQRAKLSLRNVIALLFFDALAAKPGQSDADRKTIVDHRKRIIADYAAGPPLDKTTIKGEIAKAKRACLVYLTKTALSKRIHDGKDAVTTMLRQAAQRLNDDRALMPRERQRRARLFAARAGRIADEVEVFYKAVAKQVAAGRVAVSATDGTRATVAGRRIPPSLLPSICTGQIAATRRRQRPSTRR